MKKSTFQKLAVSLFKTAGDIKKTVVFTDVAQGSYNAATDSMIETKTTTTVQAVVTNYNRKEISEQIKETDYKCKVLASDLSVVPALNDTATIDSVVYNILDITTDPARIVWTFQLRI